MVKMKSIKRKSTSEFDELCEKKSKLFCGKSFRAALKEADHFKALKEFVQLAEKSEEDVVLEYLHAGGSLQEILSLLDVTNKEDLTSALQVFKAIHFILLRVQQIESSEYYKNIKDGIKSIFISFAVTINKMLEIKNDKYRMVILKLLTSIITFQPFFSREVLNLVEIPYSMIGQLVRPERKKNSVRKCFIHFIISFFVEGNVTAIKSLVDKEGLFGSIFPDLIFDDADTVNVILIMLKEKIVQNENISTVLKMNIFSVKVLQNIFKLYDWEGPRGIKKNLKSKNEVEIDLVKKNSIIETLGLLLSNLLNSKNGGIAVLDKTIGTSNQNLNEHIFLALQSLKEPWIDENKCEIFLRVLLNCPDLIKRTLTDRESDFEPRPSKSWFKATDVIEKLLKSLNGKSISKMMNSDASVNEKINVINSICIPLALTRKMIFGVQENQVLVIQCNCMKIIALIWDKCHEFLTAFKLNFGAIEKSLMKSFSNLLSSVDHLQNLWSSLCKGEIKEDSEWSLPAPAVILSQVLKTLNLICKCSCEAIDSPGTVVSKMMDDLENGKLRLNVDELVEMEMKAIELALLADVNCLLPDSDLFEKAVLILSKKKENSIDCLRKILINTGLFENNQEEVEIWVNCYYNFQDKHEDVMSCCLVETVRQAFRRDVDLKKTDDDSVGDDVNKETVLSEWLEEASDEKTKFGSDFFECLSPMLSHSLERAKTYRDENEKEKLKVCVRFVGDVVVDLLHCYGDRVIEICKNYSSILGKPLTKYLKAWKSKNLEKVDSTVFSRSHQRKMFSWLISRDQNFVRDETDLNLVDRFLLFRMVLSYFTARLVDSDLDVENCLNFLMNQKEENEDGIFRAKCVNSLLKEKTLLKSFDVFKGEENHCTEIIVNLVMANKKCEGKITAHLWKSRFFKKLKRRMENGKSLETPHLGTVLNFFDFTENEIKVILRIATSVKDLDYFVIKEDRLSNWCLVLSKFVKFQCDRSGINKRTLVLLYKIYHHLSKYKEMNLEILDECLCHVIESRPRNLLTIGKGLVEIILNRWNTNSTTVRLAKLLMNDPDKVDRSVKLCLEDSGRLKDWKMSLPMISTLLVDDEDVRTLLRLNRRYLFWDEKSKKKKMRQVFKLVFKSFTPEIVSAIVNKNQSFIVDNKELICFLLQSFSGKKVARVLESIDFKDCKFDPELTFRAIKKMIVKKKESSSIMVEKFIEGLLTILCQSLKKLDQSESEEPFFGENFFEYVEDLTALEGINLQKSSLSGSSVWHKFTRQAIRCCLNSSRYPGLLKLIRILIEVLYNSEDDHLITIFEMITSHSEFLKAMIDSSPLKLQVIELIYCLAKRNKSVMSEKQVPVILSSYNASLSLSDQTLLRILRLYEETEIDLRQHEPFLWGEAAVNYYSVRSGCSLSQWRQINTINVFEFLNLARIEKTLRAFPKNRSFEVNSKFEADEEVYDPAFLLPLFSSLLSPGAFVYCHSFVIKGALAFTIRSLSSRSIQVRSAASFVLSRFYSHLQLTQSLKQKSLWLHFVDCIRFSIEKVETHAISNVVSAFLALTTLELSSPLVEVYEPLRKFVLAKPAFNLQVVPEFSSLFSSSDVHYQKHRIWILRLLRDVGQDEDDFNLMLGNSPPFKVLSSFYHSHLCGRELKKIILEIIRNMMKSKNGHLLITRYGLINWIDFICDDSIDFPLSEVVNLLAELTNSFQNFLKSKEISLSQVVELFNVFMKVLPRFFHLNTEINTFEIYLNSLFPLLLIILKNKNFVNVKNLRKTELKDLIRVGTKIFGQENDWTKFTETNFYFRRFIQDSNKISVNAFEKVLYVYSKLI